MTTTVRRMLPADVDEADRVTRLAFGTIRGLEDPSRMFGAAELVRSRFRARPDEAWVAERDGEIVGAVFASRWGSLGWFGPLAVRPDLWDGGVGSLLLEPVLEAFSRWDVAQAGLFTFPDSPKHLGLYQKHGFWPGALTAMMSRPVEEPASEPSLLSGAVADLAPLCESLLPGLDLASEIDAVADQAIGDTVVIRRGGEVAGFAVCHVGPGSEADDGVCFVKFGAARPGDEAAFADLLGSCAAFAAHRGATRLMAGVNTARLPAYRAMIAGGFRTFLLGVAMYSRPDQPTLDTPTHFVIDDLR